jgi:peptidoglycan-N-acetylglucosamine deacetylase
MSGLMASILVAGVAIAGLGLVYFLFFSPASQVLGHFPSRVRTERRVVALTFDDGPNEPYTTQLLDILKAHGVTATFFVVGRCVERAPAVVRRIASEGHNVGNHSYHHSFRRYFTQPSFREEIERTQGVLADTLEVRPTLFRPPWLFRQPWLLATLERAGLTPVSGEFGDELEPFQPSAERMVRRALSKVRPGAILIFHDGVEARGGDRTQTVRAIALLIPELRARGYSFATVEDLFRMGSERNGA